jgi:DNA-binding response OmpR family regulator
MLPNILIVDDSTIDLKLLMEMMAAREMRINVAFNGEDGYHKAEMLLPDLILMDWNMPGMDGFSACRMLKNNARTRDIPLIFLTAANETEKRIQGFSLGAVDYIGKPFNEQEVIARVEVHLNLARQRAGGAQVDNTTRPETHDDVLIRTATEYLQQHISAPPSPDTLAQMLGSNEKHMNRIFHDRFAMPVFGWLREERFRRAHQLLIDTSTPIADIGEHLGYSSPANFAKAFRERFGCSPRELRTQMRSRPIQP